MKRNGTLAPLQTIEATGSRIIFRQSWSKNTKCLRSNHSATVLPKDYNPW